MKKTFRKIAAFSAACLMTLSLTACGEDTATIGKIAGEDIPAGIYLYYASNAYTEVSMKKTEEQASVWDVTVDEKTAEQYIADEALLRVKKFVAIEKKFSVKFQLSDVNGLANVGDMVSLVQRLVG